MVPPTCRWILHNLGRLEKVNIVFNFPAEKPLMKTFPGAHMDTVNFGGGRETRQVEVHFFVPMRNIPAGQVYHSGEAGQQEMVS